MQCANKKSAIWQAWPAIEEKQLPCGVLRFAHGYTRRANSLIVRSAAESTFEELLAECERFFYARSQPACVCVQQVPAMAALDDFLQGRGYAANSPSLVMYRKLERGQHSARFPASLDRENWLNRFYAVNESLGSSRECHERLLGMIRGKPYFLAMDSESGATVCCALGIHYQGVLNIFNVATAPSFRRQGYASRLILSLLGWGAYRRASHAVLQVERANGAAIRLYEKLGFKCLYQYHYRIKH